MPAKPRKSWREKLADDKDLPKVVTLTTAQAQRLRVKTLAIASPREIDAMMRTVPAGRVTTINELRAAVAKRHRAGAGCPITTGIFSWMAANAAAESAAAGEANPTPYWRTLRTGGELNPKYPGGIEAVRRKLAAEGHQFERRGARVFVRDYERVIFAPSP